MLVCFLLVFYFMHLHNGTPLQYSCLENPRDGGAWWAAVHGVAQSRTRQKWLSSSSTKCEELPWWLLQCRRRVFDPRVSKIPWRRQWQPTPVFLPGISHGQRSLVGYSPWRCKRVGHDWGTTQQQHNIHLKGMILCKIFLLTFFHCALYLEYIFLLSQYWFLFLMTAWCLIIRMYFFFINNPLSLDS